MKTKFLLPHKWKRLGWILMIPSAVLGILVLFFHFRFDFLDAKVFVIYSDSVFSDGQTTLGLVDGNYTATITGILFLTGLILVAFSKEKLEDEFVTKRRLESLVWATYLNYILLVLCFLFVFDFEFLTVMIFNMFTIPIFFIIRFYYVLQKAKKLTDL